MEEAQQERRELLKAMRLLQEEKQQLQEEQKRLAREREQERETCCLLRTHNQVRGEGARRREGRQGCAGRDVTVSILHTHQLIISGNTRSRGGLILVGMHVNE